MSCGNIKLVGYNNLNNVIIKEHGSNNADYYSLIAMVEDPIFKKIVADNSINVKNSGRSNAGDSGKNKRRSGNSSVCVDGLQ